MERQYSVSLVEVHVIGRLYLGHSVVCHGVFSDETCWFYYYAQYVTVLYEVDISDTINPVH